MFRCAKPKENVYKGAPSPLADPPGCACSVRVGLKLIVRTLRLLFLGMEKMPNPVRESRSDAKQIIALYLWGRGPIWILLFVHIEQNR
jgi:hypothetical protein